MAVGFSVMSLTMSQDYYNYEFCDYYDPYYDECIGKGGKPKPGQPNKKSEAPSTVEAADIKKEELMAPALFL